MKSRLLVTDRGLLIFEWRHQAETLFEPTFSSPFQFPACRRRFENCSGHAGDWSFDKGALCAGNSEYIGVRVKFTWKAAMPEPAPPARIVLTTAANPEEANRL